MHISSSSSSILIFHRSISFDQVSVEFLLLSFHGGISFSIVPKQEDNQKMSAKNRDKFEQQDVWGWGMPLWAALPRHQTLVYMICAFVHTTRKDVRSIYHFYVAYIRTCIYKPMSGALVAQPIATCPTHRTSSCSTISPFFVLIFSLVLFLCNDGRKDPTVEG